MASNDEAYNLDRLSAVKLNGTDISIDGKQAASSVIEISVDEDPPIPDGGLEAWLMVFGAFCLACATFGYVVSWGTFQEYYEKLTLADRSPSDIAWIGSLQYSLIFFPGLLTGRAFDLGYFRASFTGSTVVYILASFLIAECRLYWHFVLCQGLALGLSAGWMYIPCIAVGTQWFKHKRPIAFSTFALGSSVGGVIFPIIFRQLVPKIGFQWTVRVIAFMNLALFLIVNVTLKTRLPPKGKSAINWEALVNIPYILYTFSTLLAFLGLYTLLTFISVSAVAIGIDSSLAFYLVAVANATSALGRIISGVLAVKHGGLNVMIVFSILTAVLIYIWPFVSNKGGFITVVCLYGVASGAFISLVSVVTTRLGSAEDVGLRTGVQMTVMSLGALAGPPISGAILQRTESFHRVGEYAGSMVIGSVIVMIVAKWTLLGKVLGGVF